MARCSGSGWYQQTLGSTLSTVGLSFRNGTLVDYSSCSTPSMYDAAFNGSATAIASTSASCGGAMNLQFLETSQAGKCLQGLNQVVKPTVAPSSRPQATPSPSPATATTTAAAITATTPANLVLIVIAPVVVVVLLVAALAAFFIYRRVKRQQKPKNPTVAIDLENTVPLRGSGDGNFTLPPSPEDEKQQTVVNTEYHIVGMPSYLIIDRSRQIQSKGLMTSGGGGSIFFGKLLDRHLVYENNGLLDCVIKNIKTVPSLSEDDNRLLFEQEVSAMASLRTHPYVAKLLGFTETPRAIVLPLYEGDLHSLIHAVGPFFTNPMALSLDFLLRLVFQAATAMSAAHAVGIIHRDIKTKNFFLEKTSSRVYPYRIRVSDFGLCRIVDPLNKNQASVNVLGLSTRYASPEVFGRLNHPHLTLDAEDEKKSDVFSFGIW